MLEIHPQNVKALYRRGVARLNLNQLDKAESDLKRAGELDPEGRARVSKPHWQVGVGRLFPDTKDFVWRYCSNLGVLSTNISS